MLHISRADELWVLFNLFIRVQERGCVLGSYIKQTKPSFIKFNVRIDSESDLDML